jgi:hypothetical protein
LKVQQGSQVEGSRKETGLLEEEETLQEPRRKWGVRGSF